MKSNKQLTATQQETLLQILRARFTKHTAWHKEIQWDDIQKKLEASPAKLWSLNEMERTGGEPDVAFYHKETATYTFVDCSAESPAQRRNLCYDDAALESRKANKPSGSALGLAQKMGVALLTEKQYHSLQLLGEFDTKTSSWVYTPSEVRTLGGALFADRRFNRAFIFHNSAESYYASRGFRSSLDV